MGKGRPSAACQMWTDIGSARKANMRDAIVRRDGSKCFHRGTETRRTKDTNAPDSRTIDHWPVPKSELPFREWLNPERAVIACLACNRLSNHKRQAERSAA
jgi:hypothetical protein